MRTYLVGVLAAVAVHGAQVYHPGVFICDTWRAWKCFDDILTPVRWNANGYDVECMSIDGKSCVKALTVAACLQLKTQPPAVTKNIVCPSDGLVATGADDVNLAAWCAKAKERLNSNYDACTLWNDPAPCSCTYDDTPLYDYDCPCAINVKACQPPVDPCTYSSQTNYAHTHCIDATTFCWTVHDETNGYAPCSIYHQAFIALNAEANHERTNSLHHQGDDLYSCHKTWFDNLQAYTYPLRADTVEFQATCTYNDQAYFSHYIYTFHNQACIYNGETCNAYDHSCSHDNEGSISYHHQTSYIDSCTYNHQTGRYTCPLQPVHNPSSYYDCGTYDRQTNNHGETCNAYDHSSTHDDQGSISYHHQTSYIGSCTYNHQAGRNTCPLQPVHDPSSKNDCGNYDNQTGYFDSHANSDHDCTSQDNCLRYYHHCSTDHHPRHCCTHDHYSYHQYCGTYNFNPCHFDSCTYNDNRYSCHHHASGHHHDCGTQDHNSCHHDCGSVQPIHDPSSHHDSCTYHNIRPFNSCTYNPSSGHHHDCGAYHHNSCHHDCGAVQPLHDASPHDDRTNYDNLRPFNSCTYNSSSGHHHNSCHHDCCTYDYSSGRHHDDLNSSHRYDCGAYHQNSYHHDCGPVQPLHDPSSHHDSCTYHHLRPVNSCTYCHSPYDHDCCSVQPLHDPSSHNHRSTYHNCPCHFDYCTYDDHCSYRTNCGTHHNHRPFNCCTDYHRTCYNHCCPVQSVHDPSSHDDCGTDYDPCQFDCGSYNHWSHHQYCGSYNHNPCLFDSCTYNHSSSNHHDYTYYDLRPRSFDSCTYDHGSSHHDDCSTYNDHGPCHFDCCTYNHGAHCSNCRTRHHHRRPFNGCTYYHRTCYNHCCSIQSLHDSSSHVDSCTCYYDWCAVQSLHDSARLVNCCTYYHHQAYHANSFANYPTTIRVDSRPVPNRKSKNHTTTHCPNNSPFQPVHDGVTNSVRPSDHHAVPWHAVPTTHPQAYTQHSAQLRPINVKLVNVPMHNWRLPRLGRVFELLG